MVDFGSTLEGRGVPQNLEAERSVLGALMLHADAVCDVGFLKPEDFYLPKHQHVFTAILATFNSKNATDPIVVEEELHRQGLIQEVGGREQLLDLLESVVSAAGVVYHAEIVREKAVQRRLLETCLDVARRCYENEAAAKDLLDDAERQRVEAALLWKYGLQSRLPANHTYATAPPDASPSSSATATPSPSPTLSTGATPTATSALPFRPLHVPMASIYASPAATRARSTAPTTNCTRGSHCPFTLNSTTSSAFVQRIRCSLCALKKYPTVHEPSLQAG
jgi:hypothetical protein